MLEEGMMDDKELSRQISGEKPSGGGKGDSEKASPTAIERYLKGMTFPADKKALIEKAKSNDAPEDVMKTLNQFEEKTYSTVIDVSKEVERIG